MTAVNSVVIHHMFGTGVKIALRSHVHETEKVHVALSYIIYIYMLEMWCLFPAVNPIRFFR